MYIQELTNPVQPIVGVSTSVAAFYGQAPQGVVDYPFQVNSWGDYQNEFGNLDSEYPLSYAVFLFFLNGGTTALVVRYNDPGVSSALGTSCPMTSRSGPVRPAPGARRSRPSSTPTTSSTRPIRSSLISPPKRDSPSISST